MLSAALLPASVAAPLVIAMLYAAPATRAAMVRLTPYAALPALLAAILAFLQPASAAHLDLSWLLLGTNLGIDAAGRPLLLLTALLWSIAGIFGTSYLRDDPDRAWFFLFYLLAMAGNIGVIVALDAVTFYVAFALMSFASYGLVIHTGTGEARRAANVYLTLVILGEVMIFAALVMLVAASGSVLLPIGEVTGATAGIACTLAILGFGIKAGLIPLHVWLPLAHPVAPTPASAVLSGAMIKAGLIGWIRFIPAESAAHGTWGILLIVLGLIGAFGGVAAGVTQRNPKTLLAYSSISQMGVMTVAVGAAMLYPEHRATLFIAAALYALHHGLAKGALFLGVGAAQSCPARTLPIIRAALLIPAFAIAGAPLTSGAMAKGALKEALAPLPGPIPATLDVLLALSAVATTLLMFRFLRIIGPGEPSRGTAGIGIPASLALLILSAAAVPFAVPIPDELRTATSFPALLKALWPIAAGAAIGLMIQRAFASRRAWTPIPAGDLLVAVERIIRGTRLPGTAPWPHISVAGKALHRALHRSAAALLAAASPGTKPDERLRDWPVYGTVFLAILGICVLLLK